MPSSDARMSSHTLVVIITTMTPWKLLRRQFTTAKGDGFRG